MLHEREHNLTDADCAEAAIIKEEYIKEVMLCDQLGLFTNDSTPVNSICDYINSTQFNPQDDEQHVLLMLIHARKSRKEEWQNEFKVQIRLEA